MDLRTILMDRRTPAAPEYIFRRSKMSSIAQTLEDRKSKHGEFHDHAGVTQAVHQVPAVVDAALGDVGGEGEGHGNFS